MKKYLFSLVFALILLAADCGGHYDVDVYHHMVLDDLKDIFVAECQDELGPSATKDEVNTCAKLKIANVVEGLFK